MIYANAPGPGDPVLVRHYGPITITGDGLDAIEFVADAVSAGASQAQTDCLTSVAVGSDETVLVVTPEAALLNGYTYTITTIRDDASNRVECDLGLSTDPLVEDYTSAFCVGTALVSDINGDGSVDVIDFAIYTSNFGAMNACFVPGDLDANGTVDVIDFAQFLIEFGAEEIGPCSVGAEAAASSYVAGPLAGLLESLGYESIAEYSEWLDSLSHAEQIEELGALFEMAQEE